MQSRASRLHPARWKLAAYRKACCLPKSCHYTRVWAACERCSEFIDRGDIAGLKALVFSLWNESPEFVALMADPDGRALAKQMLDTVYDTLATTTMVRVK